MCIFDADPFVLLKSLHPHKKAINDLAVHPSRKLALTVGRDECLAMLNLVCGRRSFCCRLGKEASLVKFDESGDRFFMAVKDKVGVHEAEDARLLCELENPQQKRVLCAAPGENGVLYTDGEDQNITVWDVNSGKVAHCIEDAHSARLKGIVVLTRNGGIIYDVDPYLVAFASLDGVIRVWDVRMAMKEKPNPLAEANTKSRLTCLAGSFIKSFKQKRPGSSSIPNEKKEKDDIEIVWLWGLLRDLGLRINRPTTLFCDHDAALKLAKNLMVHERTKHIEVDCHFTRDKIEEGIIKPKGIKTTEQFANIFTKALCQ